MPSLPPALARLTEQQLGVVARHQLRAGIPPSRIDGLVRRGALEVVERGVYRIPGGARLPQQAAFAAALRCRPGATVTGPVVLGHLGVDGFGGGDPFEILVRPGAHPTGVGFAWRTDPHPVRTVTEVGAVRLASPSDALVHSVRWRHRLGERRLRLATDWLGWRGYLDRDAFLEHLVGRAPDDPLADGLLAILGGPELARCESDGERLLSSVARCFSPPPHPQVWVTPRHRADRFFDGVRLALEYDGAVDHATPAGRRRDARRDDELAAAGVATLRVTRADLADLSRLAVRVAGEVVRRAAELGVPAPRFDPTALP